jgi:hypothetical protein
MDGKNLNTNKVKRGFLILTQETGLNNTVTINFIKNIFINNED